MILLYLILFFVSANTLALFDLPLFSPKFSGLIYVYDFQKPILYSSFQSYLAFSDPKKRMCSFSHSRSPSSIF